MSCCCLSVWSPFTFSYLALALWPSKSQELLVLPRHKVDRRVFEQRREDKEQTHGHPDVYGLNVRDLRKQTHERFPHELRETISLSYSPCVVLIGPHTHTQSSKSRQVSPIQVSVKNSNQCKKNKRIMWPRLHVFPRAGRFPFHAQPWLAVSRWCLRPPWNDDLFRHVKHSGVQSSVEQRKHEKPLNTLRHTWSERLGDAAEGVCV